jgi:hypothetical protein
MSQGYRQEVRDVRTDNRDDRYIEDSRNGRRIGPYSESEATKGAESLNDIVFRNTFPALIGLGGKPTGPFYVRKKSDPVTNLNVTNVPRR